MATVKVMIEMDEELRKEVKVESAIQGVTMTTLIVQYIQKCLPKKK
jgi:hypothetical protein